MKKWIALLALSCGTLCADASSKMGVVNFGTCATDSKQGKQEQASFEALKKQMGSLMEDTEKQLKDLSDKFNDKDYMDGLSPAAEEELKTKFRNLSEEMNRYQQQFYQVLQQANYKMLQNINQGITTASEKVAAAKGVGLVLNKEACFYYLSSLDITADVVKEMDKLFDQESKKAAPAQVAPEPKP